MPLHLHRDLETISRKVLEVGALVEESVNKAIEAVMQTRVDIAEEVINLDHRIDEAEVEVEEDVLKALALHQPVATDLRYLISVLKLNNDLERMGDLSVAMAKRARFLATEARLDVHLDFSTMSGIVRDMVRGCLDALVKRSVGRARRVLDQDDEVDRVHRENFQLLTGVMAKDPAAVERAVSFLTISRCLERIGDLATNVAEDVIFMVQGDVVRHQHAGGAPESTPY